MICFHWNCQLVFSVAYNLGLYSNKLWSENVVVLIGNVGDKQFIVAEG